MTRKPNEFQRLLAVVLVLMPLVILGAVILVVRTGEDSLRSERRERLEQVAGLTARTIDTYLAHKVHDVSILVAVGEVLAEVKRSNSVPFAQSLVDELDVYWTRERVVPAKLVRNPLRTPASDFLAGILESGHPTYLEILIADNKGRLVAASGMTTDYFQGDEEWWQEVMDAASGADSTSQFGRVGDIELDASAGGYGYDISVPVLDESTGAALGVLKVVADPREILMLLQSIHVSGNVNVELLGDTYDECTVILKHSDDTILPGERFVACEQFQEIVWSASEDETRFSFEMDPSRLEGTSNRANMLAGVAECQYAKIPWRAAVYEDEYELMTPLHTYLWLFSLGVGTISISIVAIAVYMIARRAASTTQAASVL